MSLSSRSLACGHGLASSLRQLPQLASTQLLRLASRQPDELALHRLDRFHRQRHAHLTGPFAVVDAAATPRVLVSAAAVPFRAHRGIYVVVEEIGSDTPDSSRRLEAEKSALLGVPGVAGVWTFVTNAELVSPRWSAGARRITVCWLDAEPLHVAAGIAPIVDERRRDASAPVIFAGPFETITPGEWDWFDSPR